MHPVTSDAEIPANSLKSLTPLCKDSPSDESTHTDSAFAVVVEIHLVKQLSRHNVHMSFYLLGICRLCIQCLYSSRIQLK